MRKTIVWDMDGVIIPGRGTTWLAKTSKKDPNIFIKRILSEAGSTGPLLSIPKEEIEITARMMTYNQGIMETIKSLKEKFRQIIFSDSIAPLVHKVSQHLGIEYGDGNPTYVKRNGRELLFEPSLKGYALSGRIDESWVKIKSIKNWIQKENIPYTDLVFIDDNKLDMLGEFSKLGSLSIIYYNSKDTVARIEDYRKGVVMGFHGVEDDLSKAVNLVINS
jgi:phosphoserine phosphatase